MNRSGLGELEQLVLLAVLRLGNDAYGVTIRREIRARTGRSVAPGTIYPTLDRLERKELVRSWTGEPTAQRGGRSRRHFALEHAGLRALQESWQGIASLAEGLETVLDPEPGQP
jgi:DNA-binding PadR family transcriptional regulator